MMELVEERPHFRAICKDSSAWMLPLEAYDGFIAAWTAGRSFWSGRCAYGSPVTIKLPDITGVSVWDADRLALNKEERDEQARRALVDGTP